MNIVCMIHGDQRVFQFEIIINVLVTSIRFEFEYICYVSTAMETSLTFSCGDQL